MYYVDRGEERKVCRWWWSIDKMNDIIYPGLVGEIASLLVLPAAGPTTSLSRKHPEFKVILCRKPGPGNEMLWDFCGSLAQSFRGYHLPQCAAATLKSYRTKGVVADLFGRVRVLTPSTTTPRSTVS